MAGRVSRFLGWASVPSLVLALAASDAEAVIMEHLTSDDPCEGAVTWFWDGAVPDSAEFVGTNWRFGVVIKVTAGQARIEVHGFHNTSACHAETDDPSGGAYSSNFIPLPAAGSGVTGFPTTVTAHPENHSDKFGFDLDRPAQGNSTISGIGKHRAVKKDVPAFGTWGLLAFVILLLVAGSILLRRQRSSNRAVTAS